MSENGGSVIPSNYMEQAEEWEKGLLDPAWEKQQKKTFTAWCNSHLRKVDTQIEVIEKDFEDGLKLMTLLEVISGEQQKRPEKGKLRVHKISNVNKALQFIESKGVKLVSIGAEEIVDGNLKMTLGMIWTIILRFAIQDISVEEMTAKEGLLLWCQKKTSPYKNVNVHNFHLSFKDGLAFCALIHRHRPELIEYSKLSRENPLENLNLAFDVAEKHLNIPRMLDAEDMITSVKPDERCVMAYVSSYYHAFSGAQQAEIASSRICKALRINQENEKLMQEYEDLASNLLEWIEQMRPQLENRTSVSTLPLAQKKLEEFRDYRGVQKPPKLEEKAGLETTFNNLQTRLRLNNRPAYMPTSGKLILDISTAWKNLENAEKGFEEWLLSELQRLQRLEHLAEKFKHKCDNHEEWMSGKDLLMAKDDYKLCTLNELKALKRKQEASQSDLSAHTERIQQISSIAHELNSLGYHDTASVNEREARILQDWNGLRELMDVRKARIESAEQLLEEIDQLHLEFAKKAAPFNNWMDGAKDDLVDMFIVHSTQELEILIEAHQFFKKGLVDAEEELNSICGLAEKVLEVRDEHDLMCKLDNQYTTITVEELQQRWKELQELLPVRDGVLERELEKQQKDEKLRQDFATKANTVGRWIEEQLDKVANMTLGKGSVLEDHLEAMKEMEKSLAEFRVNFNELEEINHEMQEAMVFENQHTSYSMETLRVGWESLQTSIVRNINEIENQILTRDSKGITNEQLAEYQKSFKHFDKSGNSRLEPKEFKACLISIGCNIRDDKQGEADFQRIMSFVDPNNQGHVTFESFIDFMTKESTDLDTSEQVMESFRILAGDLPYITADVLHRELPSDQAEYCISRMPAFKDDKAPNGALDYGKFSTSLYEEADV